MARILPVRFKRVAEAFDEMARARVCESSGSEYSPEGSTDLSDLVNSFIERDYRESRGNEEFIEGKDGKKGDSEKYCSDSETKDVLQRLLGCEDDDVKGHIHAEVEKVCHIVGNRLSPGFKRLLMTSLRERGFDAGLCKSKWEKTGQYPSGDYEYIDINVAGTRYIIENFLAAQFEIARPTDRYTSLFNIFPPIFVGKVEELKQIVRLMCNSIKKSMKTMDLHVPPWRRHAYVQAKWFGSYKRTINEKPVKNGLGSDGDLAKKRWVGFVPLPATSIYCREVFASKVGLKVSNFGAAINGTTMFL